MKQWDTLWGLYRRRIVFAQSEDALDAGVEELLKNAALLTKNGEAEYASELVENILVDIQSYLTIWKLDECVSAAGKERRTRFRREALTCGTPVMRKIIDAFCPGEASLTVVMFPRFS